MIFEDEAEPQLPEPKRDTAVDVNVSMQTEATASFSSDLSDDGDESDPDEENDPMIHSFGPFGADITGRMASITTKSLKASPGSFKPTKRPLHTGTFEPLIPREALSYPPPSPKKNLRAESPLSSPPSAPSLSPEPTKKIIEIDPAITNHVMNQLAFSRLSSTPLSTIMQNLPSEEKKGLTKDVLREVIESTPCIGTIERQGKDAAGKVLESEYYYIPEKDTDEQRRAAVVDGLRKPSLRACRKQHKVCLHTWVVLGNAILTRWIAILLEATAHSLSVESTRRLHCTYLRERHSQHILNEVKTHA